MAPSFNNDVFTQPEFLEGLEAAGYLQRLDTSEERITARYQHALTKMQFAAFSEAFLTGAGVRKVHGSTVQFFNETPVSDPFVHVLVGKLPRLSSVRPTLISVPGAGTTSWTPINSPDEADGTLHLTVSHSNFWPVTVVLDENPTPEMLAAEDRFDEVDDGLPPRRSGSLRNSRSASRSRYDDTEDDDDLSYRRPSRNNSRRDSYRSAGSRRGYTYDDDDDDEEEERVLAKRQRSLARRDSRSSRY